MAALDHNPGKVVQPIPSTSKTDEDKYDPVYFDSDDEDETTAKSRNDAFGVYTVLWIVIAIYGLLMQSKREHFL